MGKIIFFDIDGTLVSASGTILDSTRRAIALARENGHKTLINTGRTFQNVDPEIRELGFDGLVCGCGTHVILDGKTLFYQTQSAERCAQIAACCRDCQVSPLYERRDLMFMIQPLGNCLDFWSWKRYMNRKKPLCVRLHRQRILLFGLINLSFGTTLRVT